MFTKRKSGRTAAVFTAVAGLLLTTMAAGASAEGEPSPVFTQETGSITIYKYLDYTYSSGDVEADGRLKEGLDAAYLVNDVEFTIQRLDFELTDAAGWEAVAALGGDVTTAAERPDLDLDPVSGTTGEAASNPPDVVSGIGFVTFDNLPLGAYLVTETKTPADVAPSKPFVITVPMTNPANRDAWMYDVYVYPKNETVSLIKEVSDADAASMLREDDVVTYTVSMDVPEGTTEFVITDKLDPRLDYVAGSIFNLEGTQVDPAHEGIDEVLGGDTLVVTFTANAGAFLSGTVGFSFSAKVLKAGEIVNHADYEMTVYGTPVTGVSEDVLTKWGGYDVLKVDENNEPLADAEFTLYEVRYVSDPALSGSVIEEETEIDTQIKSDVDGKVALGDLRYSRWADNTELTPKTLDDDEPDALDDFQEGTVLPADRAPEGYVFYRLIETKAPTVGSVTYELQPRAFDFEVTGPADYNFEDPVEQTFPDLTIMNVPHNAGFELPVIGGNRAVLPILAAVVAAGGVVWLIRSRRQQSV